MDWKIEDEYLKEQLNKNKPNLTLEIVESYNFPKEISKPDWDDVQNTYTLPNGLELSTLTVCNNEPCKVDCLEGLGGFLYVNTKEELDKLINMTYEEIIEKVSSEDEDFFKDDWI